MRHITWLSAIAIAILAFQAGALSTKSATLAVESSSVISMDIMGMQEHADQNLPVTVIDNPV
jgi:hypothetical protein